MWTHLMLVLQLHWCLFKAREDRLLICCCVFLQVILPLLRSDLYEVIQAVLNRRLASSMPVWKEDSAAVTVVMASQGYPGAYPKGLEITGK